MSLEAFVYDCPETTEEAVAIMRGEGARALSGGTDLIPQLRAGHRSAARIVDLKQIPELVGIALEADGRTVLGAAASATRVARDPVVSARYPGLAAAARLIGGRQVQNRASLGGNICNAAPSADAVPALICLGAQARIAGPSGRRECKVEDLFAGPGRSTLAPDEILVSVVLPPSVERSAVTYLRFTPRREMDIAVAGAGAFIRLDDEGCVAEARIVLASVAPTPVRAPEAEAALVGTILSRAVLRSAGETAAGESSPISDTRGSAGYRRDLVRVLTARALEACCNAIGTEIEDV